MVGGEARSWLRQKGGKNESRVSFVELFFDLVFVFSVAQLAHALAQHFTLVGILQTTLMTFAVWWVWIFTAWVTNWLDPDRMPVRIMLFVLMFAGLMLSGSIPEAFGEKGWLFAASYVFMQVGRSLFAVYAMRDVSPGNHRNFMRITCWLIVSGVIWITGAFFEGEERLLIWLVALLIEYAAPAAGFVVPGLGRSTPADWNVSGAHLAERCAAFVLICLGEAVLEGGETFSELPFNTPDIVMMVTVFIRTIAMWWLYFQFGHERAAHRIEHDKAPGSLARQAFTYAHIPILAGIILDVVANNFAFANQRDIAGFGVTATILGAPLIFLLGNLWFKAATSGRMPLSHLAGIVVLALLMVMANGFDVFEVEIVSTGVLVAVAVWEFLSLTRVLSRR